MFIGFLRVDVGGFVGGFTIDTGKTQWALEDLNL